jgi:hypothetical protein
MYLGITRLYNMFVYQILRLQDVITNKNKKAFHGIKLKGNESE